ncbi:MAG: IS3 family transposase [Desulfobacterales bacterium]|nr:IS3 family transposase [Desulfobacterales bacterium]
MPRKRYTPEQIISKLREAEVLLSQGQTVTQASKQLSVSEQTYYRWRKEYGGMRTSQVRRLKDLEKENVRLKKLVADLALDNAILKEASFGKLISPARRRRAVERVQQTLGVSERRACTVLSQPRSTQRYSVNRAEDEAVLTEHIIELASQYGRYGYRRITAMLRNQGWRVNHKRVERIWRKEGLKVPAKQPKRSRLWLNDGSCIRLRPQYLNHVWSYDFVQDRTHNGRAFRILNIIDEYSRECLATFAARHIRHGDVQECLTELFCQRGIPAHIRSDNGPEFTAKMLRKWLNKLSIGTLFIEPGSPWENGYVESFNGRMRDELLNLEIFYTMKEAKHLIEMWRWEYNHIRPHSSLGYKPPAPSAWIAITEPLEQVSLT